MEGGMLVTDDEELYHLALSMRAHGWVRDIPEDSPVYEHRADDFSEAYRFILPGYNLRPLELSGAVGCEQLKKLPGFIAQRRKNLALFEDLFAADDRLSIQKQNGESSSFCFPIVIASADIEERENVFSELRAADIGFRIVTGGCFPRHDAIRYFDYSCVNDLPNANMIHDFGFFLGNHPFDLSRQITTAYGVIDSALSRSGKKS
jgi:CDP-6-deoxy-D-xylo-4-hexulose-3-dehydrase